MRWLGIAFDYVNPAELLAVAATVAVGILLARFANRHRDATGVRLLRRAQTGSVNDYAAYAVAGMLAVIAVLTLT